MLVKMIIVSLILVGIAYFGRDADPLIVDQMYDKIDNVYFLSDESLFQNEWMMPYNNKLNTYDVLYSESDEVYRVRPVSREQFGNTFLTKCEVVEKIKQTDSSLKNKEVVITETAFIENYDEHDLKIVGFITPMKYAQEYVVFLRKNPGFEDTYYVQVSNVFGIIPLKEHLNIFDQMDRTIKLDMNSLDEYDVVYDPLVSASSSYASYIDDYINLHKTVIEKHYNK